MFTTDSIINTLQKIVANRVIIDRVLKIAIAFGLLIFLVGYISITEIAAAFSEANYSYILYASLLSLVNIFLQAYKWKLVLNLSLGEISFVRVLGSYFSGISSGLSTPARIGEFIGRAIPLKEFNFFDVTIVSFIDKIINMLVITFFGSIASVLFYRTLNASHFYVDIPLLISIIVIFSLFIYLLFTNGFFVAIIRRKFKSNEKVLNKIKIVDKFLSQSYKGKLQIFSINVLFLLVILLQFALLVNAFAEFSNYYQLMIIASLILFATTVVLPFSFGDLGVREGAASYLIALVGLAPAIGFNSALVLFVVNVILPAIIGLLFLVKKK
ncbi:MAG: lysylphosphatidylglycerol synthase transmembrane domain-containing protein [Melioribacteraceae bacterium]|nr:MAG: lysylphosphatidylglycerol synthase transmembrane domain-containing protein [Melioribacteraceae bacterium]